MRTDEKCFQNVYVCGGGGVSRCCTAKTNPTSIHEDEGSIPDLTQWVKEHCFELWYRWKMWLGSGLAVLWCMPAAVALIWPLAWELPYAAGTALKKKKVYVFFLFLNWKKKKKKKNQVLKQRRI